MRVCIDILINDLYELNQEKNPFYKILDLDFFKKQWTWIWTFGLGFGLLKNTQASSPSLMHCFAKENNSSSKLEWKIKTYQKNEEGD